MTKARLAPLVAVAVLAGLPAGASAQCVQGVCVTGVVENVENVTATFWGTYDTATRTATGQTRALADQVLTPVENHGPVCTPTVPSTTPVCVTGIGTPVKNAQATACEEVPAQLIWDYATNRCGLYP